MSRKNKTASLWLLMVAAGVYCWAEASPAAPEKTVGERVTGKVAAEQFVATGNLLRNAGFELDSVFNGGPMRQGTEFIRAVLLYQGNCPRPPCEGWWVEGNPGDGVSLERKEVHSGLRAMRVTPPAGKKLSVASAPEMPVPVGVLTLSAWVRTCSAKASLELELVAAGAHADQDPRHYDPFPAGELGCRRTATEWTRVELTAEAPADAAAVVRLVVDGGRVVADDLQLETGRVPTAFNVRREEWLKLSFEGTPESRLPCWMAEDNMPRKLLVCNDSNVTIDGDLEIWAGPWSATEKRKVVRDEKHCTKGRGRCNDSAAADHLKPDAYVWLRS